MSLIGRALRSIVNLGHPRDPGIAMLFGRDDGDVGVPVDYDGALGVPSVWAAITVIAETLGSAPTHLYRKLADGTREPYSDHPIYGLINSRPTPFLTAMEWKEIAVRDACLYGDAPQEIIMDGQGRVTALEPLDPMAISVAKGLDGRPVFRLGGRVLFDGELLRLPYKLHRDGRALSPLDAHRLTLGTAIAARRQTARMFKNGVMLRGALTTPQVYSPESAKRLRADFERMHGGPDNAGKVAILDGGIEFKPLSMSNVDAQFAELSGMTVLDVARIYRVPPHKIQDLSRATFSNIEHQSIEFIRDTILPWARRHEERWNASLLTASERAEFEIGYDLRGFLRGDAKARAEYYRQLFYMSAISPNEIRAMESMARIEGGDEYFVQGATVPLDLLDRIHGGETEGTAK